MGKVSVRSAKSLIVCVWDLVDCDARDQFKLRLVAKYRCESSPNLSCVLSTHFTRAMSAQAFLADHALRAFTCSFCYKPCGNAGGLARHQASSGHGTRPSLSGHARDNEWSGPSITVTYHERFRGTFKFILFCF
jgi:hypothetical protein